MIKKEEIEAPLTAQEIETRPHVQQEETYGSNYYSDVETELEELTLDEINEMLGETPIEEPQKSIQTPEGDNDLIDEILKEIEMDRD